MDKMLYRYLTQYCRNVIWKREKRSNDEPNDEWSVFTKLDLTTTGSVKVKTRGTFKM